MRLVRKAAMVSGISVRAKKRGRSVGFVPTMGALHEGHLSLIRRARKENDLVIVSIFVNPTQFSPPEDLKNYPRNMKKDLRLCRKERVDVIFYPAVNEMYPAGYKTYLTVRGLGDRMCGRFRPGHFNGVATVVAKLFNIAQPDRAYFGQKDAQQAAIIKRIAQDLNIPVKIKVLPIVRDSQGLALSSRNAYLSKKESSEALVLYHAIGLARSLIKSGRRDARIIVAKMRSEIKKSRSAKVQYISIVDPESLKPLKRLKGRVLIALAVWVGRKRLIDNITVNC
ncbi:pantoate--beta-alanine ligase [Candidatus Omnitrophota bacterium]